MAAPPSAALRTRPGSLASRRGPLPGFGLSLGVALFWLSALVLIPLGALLLRPWELGVSGLWRSLSEPRVLAALRLSFLGALTASAVTLPFGLLLAWVLVRYEFPGKRIFDALIDLPFAVSPVVAGLVFILLFGSQGWFGSWLQDNDLRIVYAVPGIILATLFVTFPLVARELIPLMQAQGTEEELAALTLGATGWQIFWRVTLPNIKWGLLYGAILANARAMGEFGAVSVVSGHVRGLTNTMTLHVEILYNEYMFAASFAVASLLAMLALVTLVLKSALEWRHDRQQAAAPVEEATMALDGRVAVA